MGNEKIPYAEEIKEPVYHLPTLEKELIQKALDKFNGHRGKAAAALGISERNLYHKLKKIEMQTAYVLGFMFSEDRKHVLLIRKVKPKWQSGKLNGLGGKMEDGETIFESMTREFKEETDLETIGSNWDLFAQITDNDNYIVNVFRCFDNRLFEAKTMEHAKHAPEVIGIYEVDKLKEEETIENLYWMIHLALDTNPSYSVINYPSY